jgi:hypothetical protein
MWADLKPVVLRGRRRLVFEGIGLASLHAAQDDLSFLFNGFGSHDCCLSS